MKKMLDEALGFRGNREKKSNTFRLAFEVERGEEDVCYIQNTDQNAQSSFELSCIWEDVRNAFWIKKTISREMYNKRGAEIVAKRNEISKKH